MSRKSLLFSCAALAGWLALSGAAFAQAMDSRQAMQLGKQAYEGNPAAYAQLKAAAQAGSTAAESVLGALYQEGAPTINKDEASAVKLFRQAAEQGDADAQFGLGVMLANGHGAAQDYAAAAHWFQKAAALGNPAPCFYLGLLYENGLGVSKDYAEATKWYSRAAATTGPIGLQFDLATGGAKELRPPEDSSQVIKDFPMVPDHAQAGAAYNLGMMSWNGRGAAANSVEAYKWFVLATTRGSRLAEYNLRNLARGMSQKQISDAVARAAAWEAEHPSRSAEKPASR